MDGRTNGPMVWRRRLRRLMRESNFEPGVDYVVLLLFLPHVRVISISTLNGWDRFNSVTRQSCYYCSDGIKRRRRRRRDLPRWTTERALCVRQRWMLLLLLSLLTTTTMLMLVLLPPGKKIWQKISFFSPETNLFLSEEVGCTKKIFCSRRKKMFWRKFLKGVCSHSCDSKMQSCRRWETKEEWTELLVQDRMFSEI